MWHEAVGMGLCIWCMGLVVSNLHIPHMRTWSSISPCVDVLAPHIPSVCVSWAPH